MWDRFGTPNCRRATSRPARREPGRLFEDIEERFCAEDSVAFSVADLLHDLQPFQPFDGALRRGKRNAEFLGSALGGDEGIGGEQLKHS